MEGGSKSVERKGGRGEARRGRRGGRRTGKQTEEETKPLKQTQHAQLDLCAFECALLAPRLGKLVEMKRMLERDEAAMIWRLANLWGLRSRR